MQAKRFMAAPEERAPVGDALLSCLYRAEPSEIAGIVAPLPGGVRAALAGFCYARAHLRAIGREIAEHCDEISLLHYAGPAMARSLIEARKRGKGDSAGATPERPGRPKVTLASAADMRRREPIVGDVDEVE